MVGKVRYVCTYILQGLLLKKKHNSGKIISLESSQVKSARIFFFGRWDQLVSRVFFEAASIR